MAGRSKFIESLLVFLIKCIVQACVSCNSGGEWETVAVVLGASLTLDCTYNCSSGFVQGQWSRAGQVVGCTSCQTMLLGDLCTLSLRVHMDELSNQTPLNYSCQSCQTDQPLVPCRTERRVVLKICTSPKATSLPPATSKTTTPDDGAPNNTEDEYKVVMVLAIVTLVVVVVLTSCLCFLRYKGKCAAHTEKTPARDHDRPGSDKDYASVTFTNTDCQSDHEVPYAEIMISVPGVSTPELRALPSGAPGPPRPRWREDSGLGPLQHTSRSADRLHVQPRDVCRKMSSTSEYAIITYSSDALH